MRDVPGPRAECPSLLLGSAAPILASKTSQLWMTCASADLLRSGPIIVALWCGFRTCSSPLTSCYSLLTHHFSLPTPASLSPPPVPLPPPQNP
eukprot:299678-Rhodomonas_salina.1